MAMSNVANMPVLANAGSAMDRISALAKTVPVKNWRLGAMAVILFWACSTLVDLFWAVMPAPELPTPQVTPAVASSVKAASNQKSIDIASLQALKLFGDFDPDALPESDIKTPVPGERLKKTKLNLELQGVIASSDPTQSWAIIGKTASQKLYKVGDAIEGVRGVKIAEIRDVKVIINNNGTLEELWLYGKDGKNFAKSSAVTQPRARAPQPPKQNESVAQVSRDEVMQVKSIGDVVRFMVATEDGKMVGYKVRPGRKRKLFDQVGLKTDDIVISVNGIEVNEPQKVREVYQALKNATEANLEVMRDGTSHSINISMSPEG